MAEKVSRDRGYRSDTIALSRDMGPLRVLQRDLELLQDGLHVGFQQGFVKVLTRNGISVGPDEGGRM